ncbi:RNA-directed DNA polymerase from mobile element jockey [Chionoecetes opilio]|uniref:RNA-directed DNA polymerase from mobile element jockey n=1 Tax=Chionoecetes opilio TaxID=41210 RepID=A0A8J4YBK1_CHIOP|nr:RNA-directed DNA polymerase from mobile element jockey [Chionoecetes opilio]
MMQSVIFAESLEVLVMALEALHEEAKPLGLEVSWLKTKVQLYADLAREGKPLHAINTQLRDLNLPRLLAHRRPRLSPPMPAPAKPNLPPATAVHPGVQYSTINAGNRYGPLQEALEDDASLPQDPVISPEPGSTPPPVRRRNHLRKPRRLPGYLAPPSTPTPSDLDSGFTHSTIATEVHQPQGSPSHRGQGPVRAFRHAAPLLPSPVMPPRPPAPPWDPARLPAAPASSASSRDTVISSLFTLLWKGYHLYQEGTPVPDDMALTLLLWNARSLLWKSSELHTYLRDSLPSVAGLCETWLPPHLTLNLPGYSILRRERQQSRGGGVLLALRDVLLHSPLPFPQWPAGHLEVVAARVSLRRGWLTVAVIYNPGGVATSQGFEHYIASLPPPVIIMGDFNAHHQCWEPDVPLHKRNPSGNTLFKIMLDSPHLSLLSPPGLATRFHPHTCAPSVLDLFIGDPAFTTSTFSTEPYMGSDHLPVLASVPQAPPKPHPGYLPRWRITSSEWLHYREAIQPSPDFYTLPLEDSATSFHQTLEIAGAAAFYLATRRTPRRPGKPWWNDDCAQAVLARRRAWNQWRQTPTILAGTSYRRLDALCAKTLLKAQRSAWGSHCSSLSFSSSTKRTWDLGVSPHPSDGRCSVFIG